MAIYELKKDGISQLKETNFEAEGIRERDDLQRLLRTNIEVIAPDTLVIAEEFGDWEDSRRRIDLLGLDRQGNLVVIELKRTEEGAHMELQALRYAAMISTMTFDKAVEIYSRLLASNGEYSDARERILAFLGWEDSNETEFAQDVKIVLASADFSKELTTSVIWLNDRGLDIRCIRLKPYRLNEQLLIDAQQIVPLPEIEEYQVQIREKEQLGRSDRAERFGLRKKFWTGLLNYARGKCEVHANISPSEQHWISASAGLRGVTYNYLVLKEGTAVEVYIDRGDESENKDIFDRLLSHRQEIDTAFGSVLEWQRLDEKRACRIRKTLATGGLRSAETTWPEVYRQLVDAMNRLEKSFGSHLRSIKKAA